MKVHDMLVEERRRMADLLDGLDAGQLATPSLSAGWTVHDIPVLLGFGAVAGALNLSPAGDLHEAARNLFAMLHELDARSERIAVAPIPHVGLGEAINDRLKRAAAPRDK